jgi:hypothetical protein
MAFSDRADTGFGVTRYDELFDFSGSFDEPKTE